jgi:hypothetical protein
VQGIPAEVGNPAKIRMSVAPPLAQEKVKYPISIKNE